MRHYHWPNCVGAIDGTCVVLYQRPRIEGGDYSDRKGNYSVNLQAVVDPGGRIRYWFAGMPGSQHDATVFKAMLLASQPDRYFTGLEHLLADSAYPSSKMCVPAYKRARGRRLGAGCIKFNYLLSDGIPVSGTKYPVCLRYARYIFGNKYIGS